MSCSAPGAPRGSCRPGAAPRTRRPGRRRPGRPARILCAITSPRRHAAAPGDPRAARRAGQLAHPRVSRPPRPAALHRPRSSMTASSPARDTAWPGTLAPNRTAKRRTQPINPSRHRLLARRTPPSGRPRLDRTRADVCNWAAIGATVARDRPRSVTTSPSLAAPFGKVVPRPHGGR